MSFIFITEVDTVSSELIEAMERLLPQLGQEAGVPSKEHLIKILESPTTRLLVARDTSKDSTIVGMLTLAVYRIPTGTRAWIENFVVDESARGKGFGTALLKYAISLAQAMDATKIDLTSRPIKQREDANRLYQSLGFDLRETLVYRFTNTFDSKNFMNHVNPEQYEDEDSF